MSSEWKEPNPFLTSFEKLRFWALHKAFALCLKTVYIIKDFKLINKFQKRVESDSLAKLIVVLKIPNFNSFFKKDDSSNRCEMWDLISHTSLHSELQYYFTYNDIVYNDIRRRNLFLRRTKTFESIVKFIFKMKFKTMGGVKIKKICKN